MGQVNRFWSGRAWQAVATGFGAGLVPVAPGTAGSLLALPAWYWGKGKWAIHLGILAIVLLLAIPAATARIRKTGDKDPPSVVIDEVAGMLVASAGIPWGWREVVLAFLLFRVFDIFKWGPAAWMNAKEGAVYVVGDDLFSGLYANLACRGIVWLTG